LVVLLAPDRILSLKFHEALVKLKKGDQTEINSQFFFVSLHFIFYYERKNL